MASKKLALTAEVQADLRLIWQLAGSVREAVNDLIQDDVVDDEKCEEAVTHARDIGGLVNRILRRAGMNALGDISPLDHAPAD